MTNRSTRIPGFIQGIMLLLPITMSVAGISVFTATAALMTQHFGDLPNGDYLVQLLITMPAIWILLFSPIAGWLADRYGRRRMLIGSMIVYAGVGIAPFFIENIYLIILTRCGVGVCESIVMTVTTAMISDYYKGRTRERWLAAQTATASLSALLIIWAGGQLGAKYGWQGPFLVYIYSLVLVIGVIRFTWEPAKDSALELATADTDARFQHFPMARMVGICAITLVASVMFYSTITQNANALVSLGVTNPDTIGNLSSLASLGVPIGTFVFWVLGGRLNIGWLLFLDAALIGTGFLWMGQATTPSEYAWAANLQQIGCGMVLPTMLVWATRGLAFHIRGRGAGMWQASFAIGQFVSGMALTFLGKQLGGLLPTFTALGKFCVAAAVVTLIAHFALNRRADPAAAPQAQG